MSNEDKCLKFDQVILRDLTPLVQVLPNTFEHMICGGSGDVYKANLTTLSRTRLVAVKVPRIHGRRDPQKVVTKFLREVVLWSALEHPNIVPCLGVTFHGQNAGIPTVVMPWYENGSLAHFLSKYSKVEKLPFILQVGNALQHLHSLDIAHGDIKAQNVLVTSDVPPRAVLTDFGLSRPLNGVKAFSSSAIQGTLHFMAPELLQYLVYDGLHYKNHGCTKETDVWAFGMFIVQVYCGRLPLTLPQDRRTEYELARLVVVEGYLPSPADASEVPWKIWQSGILLHCWEHNAAKRIGVQGAIMDLKEMDGV
ncbi:kinase-like domain-containing protein [Flagelloscypha sp. PMI_526]|nr:kinase-like domain-containing protein [Flagelloscypha sp. PMI_526]